MSNLFHYLPKPLNLHLVKEMTTPFLQVGLPPMDCMEGLGQPFYEIVEIEETIYEDVSGFYYEPFSVITLADFIAPF